MKALVKTQKGKGFVELLDVPEPVAGPGEVLIEVKACGICGTDVHVLHDEFPYRPPVILGHEFSGEIVGLGPGASLYKVGDRVVGEPHTQACGQCYLCRTGNIQICKSKRSPGWGIDGAFARYLKMPERLLHRIPENVSFDTAAVVEPAANTVHDVIERAKVEAGDFVVVVGPGPIGLLAGMTARAGGARRVVVIGTKQDEAVRLAKAREIGFDTAHRRRRPGHRGSGNRNDRRHWRGPGRRVQRLSAGDRFGHRSREKEGAYLRHRTHRQIDHPVPVGQGGVQGLRPVLQPVDQLHRVGTGRSTWSRRACCPSIR